LKQGLGRARYTGCASDVPDSQGFQAIFRGLIERFSLAQQGLVNHPGQALVNHARECIPGDIGLTSLFKRFRKGRWHALGYRPGT
jgi:hypothetical protein